MRRRIVDIVDGEGHDRFVTDFNDPARLRGLARWVEAFERPGFSIGAWAGGERGADGAIQMPYMEISDEAQRFVSEMYEQGWVHSFDWMAWAGTAEAQVLIGDPSRIGEASADDLARLLTTIIRGERFSEGELAGAFERGTLTAIARRAGALIDR